VANSSQQKEPGLNLSIRVIRGSIQKAVVRFQLSVFSPNIAAGFLLRTEENDSLYPW